MTNEDEILTEIVLFKQVEQADEQNSEQMDEKTTIELVNNNYGATQERHTHKSKGRWGAKRGNSSASHENIVTEAIKSRRSRSEAEESSENQNQLEEVNPIEKIAHKKDQNVQRSAKSDRFHEELKFQSEQISEKLKELFNKINELQIRSLRVSRTIDSFEIQ